MYLVLEHYESVYLLFVMDETISEKLFWHNINSIMIVNIFMFSKNILTYCKNSFMRISKLREKLVCIHLWFIFVQR